MQDRAAVFQDSNTTRGRQTEKENQHATKKQGKAFSKRSAFRSGTMRMSLNLGDGENNPTEVRHLEC